MSESDLAQRFETRLERFAHGRLSLELLLPRAADELIDEDEFVADERLPYWAELWPSSRALARHLIEASLPRGPVLELGCGIALPSLVLLARGVEVLATDYYDDALRFARANAERNELSPLPTALLDWRQIPPGFSRFPEIVVADALYEPRYADILASVLPRLVAPGGRAVIADPGRVYLGEFRGLMEELGWTVRDLEVREEISDPATGAASRVQLVELRPRSAPH